MFYIEPTEPHNPLNGLGNMKCTRKKNGNPVFSIENNKKTKRKTATQCPFFVQEPCKQDRLMAFGS